MPKPKQIKLILPKGGSLIPLFSIDDNNDFVINREFVKGMEPFKSIYEKDRTNEKYYAHKIFMLMYLVYDVNSELAGLSEKELMPKAYRLAGITREDIRPVDWELFKEAKETYEMLYENLNPQYKIHKTLKKSLTMADKVLSKQMEKLEEILEELEGDYNKDEEESKISKVTSSLNTLFSLGNSIPVIIKNIDEVMNSIRKSEITDVEVRGGGTLSDREDPSYAANKFGTNTKQMLKEE